MSRASDCWKPVPMTCITPASSTTNSTIADVLPTLNRVSEIGVRIDVGPAPSRISVSPSGGPRS